MRLLHGRGQALLALAVVAACEHVPSCQGGTLAEVIKASGDVQLDHAAHVGQWQRAEVGAQLARGDGLRTRAKSSAVLRVGRNGVLRVASDTTLRLYRAGDAQAGSAGLEMISGSAVLEAGESEVPLRTSAGTAVLRAGSRMRLRGEHGGVRYEVVIGAAAFRQQDGKTLDVGAGQSIVVGIGMAVLDGIGGTKLGPAPDPGRAEPKAAEAQEVPAAGAGAGAVQAMVSGGVRRRASQARDWTDLARGASELGPGDDLEVREDGLAELTRGDERATLHRGRYAIGAPGAALVRAADGTLLVTAERTPVVISVPGGTITARAVAGGSRADIVVHGDDGTADVEVLSGSVKTASAQGETLLEAGEQASLATLPDKHTKHAAAARSADVAELVVSAGESFRVYDPSPPTAIGFGLGKHCHRGAEIRVDGKDPVRGTSQLNVLVGPGIHRYQVHCLRGGQPERRPAISSSLRVLRSDGTRRPPTSAVRNDVELDGRNYTLMYQNLKPLLSVRWPNAPRASGYVLQLERPDGSIKSVRSKQPRATVEPSLLSDGAHELQFETADANSVRSKQTRISLVFDNAAPTASLSQPPPAGFAPGSAVSVSGVTLAGSRASVGGRAIAVDRAGRFAAEVQLRPGQHAFAVRFRHPKHGIRYYLRRAAGGAP